MGTAGRAVAAKSSISALEGILVECVPTGVRMTGYNLNTGITTFVEADVAETGSTVLSARLFGDIIRKLPDDTAVISGAGENIHITCGPAAFDILGSDPEEFPALPAVGEGNSLTMTQGRMKDMISRTIFAIATNDSRPVHTGELFDVEDGRLTLVALDGFRLALRRENSEGTGGVGTFSFVAPGSALAEVEKICADSEDLVSITQGEHHITFQMGDTMLVSRRLEGQFLDYRTAIPRDSKVQVSVRTRDLQASIERTSLIINEKLKSPVRCKFGDGVLTMTSRTALGSALDQCPIDGDGGGLEIGFNNRYLMETARAVPTETVCLKLSTRNSPCLFLPQEGDSFLYMNLPVRMRDE